MMFRFHIKTRRCEVKGMMVITPTYAKYKASITSFFFYFSSESEEEGKYV
jgi:hypothetical protein